MRNFEKDLAIDKYRLDEECLSHSGVYAYYAESQASAKMELTRAKDNFEFITAEANLRIRKEYAEKGEKFTEAVISSQISMDEKVNESKRNLREKEEIYYQLTVAAQAMETRRSELDNLVKLYCAGYFSTVKADGNVRKGINEQVSADIRKNLNK